MTAERYGIVCFIMVGCFYEVVLCIHVLDCVLLFCVRRNSAWRQRDKFVKAVMEYLGDWLGCPCCIKKICVYIYYLCI